jgi:hypothetical protein
VVLLLRIELRIHPYHGCGMPFTYKSRKPTEVGFVWSGKGGSNSRHSRWQRDALPTELFPHVSIYSKFSAVNVSTVAGLITTSLRTLASNTASCRACFCFFKLETMPLKLIMSSALNTPVSTVSP